MPQNVTAPKVEVEVEVEVEDVEVEKIFFVQHVKYIIVSQIHNLYLNFT